MFPAQTAVFTLLAAAFCRASLHSSVANMRQLVHTERMFFNIIAGVIEVENRRLELLRRAADSFAWPNTIPADSFLENPINSYLLLKRLTMHFQSVESLVSDDAGYVHLKDSLKDSEERYVMPSENDLAGAAVALLRVQEFHRISARDLVRGGLPGTATDFVLDTSDCLRLGKIYAIRGEHDMWIEWVEEAVSLWNNGDNDYGVSQEIMLHLQALDITISTMMEIPTETGYPDISALQKRLEVVKTVFADQSDVQMSGTVNYKEWLQKPDQDGFHVGEKGHKHLFSGYKTYISLCRGENHLNPSRARHLHCLYETNDSPFLLIQPVKTEIMHMDPRVVVFHGIFSDRVVDGIKNAAQYVGLRPALVQDINDNNTNKEVSYRTASNAWLAEALHPIVRQANRFISAATGLDLSTAEQLQVANYGLGGHYAPHYDDNGVLHPQLVGHRRIATFMVYGSDVTLGGATVFPQLELTVWPRRGSAIFWYNVLPSGAGDPRTLHAGCPVLVGDKWVFNKWISPLGQEFRRPCGLLEN